MRKILASLICLFFAFLTYGQVRIPVDSAANHIGDSVIVCAEVFGVKTTRTITFINVGAAYPNSPLTVVIFAKDLDRFKPSPEALYNGRKSCFRGVIVDFKGKAEIVVTKPEDITVE